MQVTIDTNANNTIEAVNVKMTLEKIAKNFDKENLAEIAKLSQIPNANEKIRKLFNNPLFKMAL